MGSIFNVLLCRLAQRWLGKSLGSRISGSVRTSPSFRSMAAKLARWKIKSKAGKRLMAHNLHETVGAKTVVRERERYTHTSVLSHSNQAWCIRRWRIAGGIHLPTSPPPLSLIEMCVSERERVRVCACVCVRWKVKRAKFTHRLRRWNMMNEAKIIFFQLSTRRRSLTYLQIKAAFCWSNNNNSHDNRNRKI